MKSWKIFAVFSVTHVGEHHWRSPVVKEVKLVFGLLSTDEVVT